MDKLLDQKLCEDFPEIFKNRRGDMRVTAMCWGFECGDGWEPLIRATCDQIMAPIYRLRKDIKIIENGLAKGDRTNWKEWHFKFFSQENLENRRAQLAEKEKCIPVAQQVKEKYGGLRFYVYGGDDEQTSIVQHAERMSHYVCEQCGTMKGTMTYTFGWYRTLCPRDAEECYGDEAKHFRDSTGPWSPDGDDDDDGGFFT